MDTTHQNQVAAELQHTLEALWQIDALAAVLASSDPDELDALELRNFGAAMRSILEPTFEAIRIATGCLRAGTEQASAEIRSIT